MPLVPVDGIVLSKEILFMPAAGGVSLSLGVSNESELNREVLFAGPSLVNRPRRGYLVDPCVVGAG
jgi:hypothetical protein